MNDWAKAACGKFQSGEGDGQLETARPGASRIEIEHTVNPFDPRLMRVAGNDHVNSAICWIDLQLLKVVQNIEGPLAEPYHPSVGIAFRPVADIDVSSDRSDGRDPTESDENVRATNIASVDDMRHPGEPSPSLGPQEPVGVRDDSDPQHCAVSLHARPNGGVRLSRSRINHA
jgi:hypothetical protein